uniref:Uncharacterized protein n=1 Tax=Dulem virus 65 TaxID=3145776 RepID=A0AAU8B8E7_9VIRU
MAYVCEVLQTHHTMTTEGVKYFQICAKWVVYQHPLAITKSEMILIGGSLLSVAGIFVAYTIISKAVKLL